MVGPTLSPKLDAALKSGVEIGLARAIAAGQPPETIGQFIEARLSGLSQSEIDYTRQLANAILAAADALSALDPEETIDTDDNTDWPRSNWKRLGGASSILVWAMELSWHR